MPDTTDLYQGYAPTPEATDEQVKAWFKAKFGYLPEHVIRSKAAVLAGPLRQNDD